MVTSKKVKIIVVTIVMSIVGLGTYIYPNYINPMIKYNKGVNLLDTGNEISAIEEFEEILDYKDSYDLLRVANYNLGIKTIESDEIQAIKYLKSSANYSNSEALINQIITNNNTNILAIGADNSIGLTEYGIIRESNSSSKYENISLWNDLISIDMRDSHIVGLDVAGNAMATGYNLYGQCNVDKWDKLLGIAAGSWHTVGIKADGTVVATGQNLYNELDVEEWEDIVYISAGCFYTAGVKLDGTVVATGNNEGGKTDVDDWTEITKVATAMYHTVGLRKDGTVVAVGDNQDGRCDVDDWKNIKSISIHNEHTVALKEDGTVVATGNNEFGQCDVSAWNDVVTIITGKHCTVGVNSKGNIFYAGDINANAHILVNWENIKI